MYRDTMFLLDMPTDSWKRNDNNQKPLLGNDPYRVVHNPIFILLVRPDYLIVRTLQNMDTNSRRWWAEASNGWLRLHAPLLMTSFEKVTLLRPL